MPDRAGRLERVDGREQRAFSRDHLFYPLRSEAQMLAKQPVPEAGDGCLDARVRPLDGEVALVSRPRERLVKFAEPTRRTYRQ